MGSLAGALLVITFFVRIFPIIPIHETIEEEHEKAESTIVPVNKIVIEQHEKLQTS